MMYKIAGNYYSDSFLRNIIGIFVNGSDDNWDVDVLLANTIRQSVAYNTEWIKATSLPKARKIMNQLYKAAADAQGTVNGYESSTCCLLQRGKILAATRNISGYHIANYQVRVCFGGRDIYLYFKDYELTREVLTDIYSSDSSKMMIVDKLGMINRDIIPSIRTIEFAPKIREGDILLGMEVNYTSKDCSGTLLVETLNFGLFEDKESVSKTIASLAKECGLPHSKYFAFDRDKVYAAQFNPGYDVFSITLEYPDERLYHITVDPEDDDLLQELREDLKNFLALEKEIKQV